VLRVTDLMPPDTPDHEIVEHAAREQRVVLTQDLDFSAIVALSGASSPSVIQLRLSSARVEDVNSALERTLATIADDLCAGAIASIEDDRVRIRRLPMQ